MSHILETQRRLFQVFDGVIARENLELVAVEMLQLHGRSTVRVSIDGPGGVQVGDCSRVSHTLSALLDVEDELKGAFDLEVSSPGLERPLQREGDFARFAGYRAKIRLLPNGEGRRRYSGLLKGVEGSKVVIDAHDDCFELELNQIEKAHLLLELEELAELTTGNNARGESS